MGLNDTLKQAQLWPIHAKGKATRLNPLGDPKIAKYYGNSLEQGRLLEKSIGDANLWLMERKREVLARINTYLDINKVATNAQPKRHLRQFLLAANCITFLNEVASFQGEITDLGNALTQNINMLQMIEQNMLRAVQENLNAIANLLHDICNWGLPDVAAIPNLFSDTIWYWNGFNFFPLGAYQPHVGFDKNFAFQQCVIHTPNINIFRNYPTTVQTYSNLTYGAPPFVPPLGGIIPNTGYNWTPEQLEANKTSPVYAPTFDPTVNMLGSVPDPSSIISNYQMPAGTYRDNIVAIVSQTRGNTVQVGDADYSNPNLAVRNPRLRADLVHYVTLQQVVESGYDPNLTAEWLFYLDNGRTGRGGVWLPNFQDVYSKYIQPSVDYLNTTPVPWNDLFGTLATGPTGLPFLQLGTDPNLQSILWKLSYVEASILGYTRTKDWDSNAALGYVDSFTGTDLDYQTTAYDPAITSAVTLGQTTASYPTPCTFPSAIGEVLQAVITKATADIANDPTFKATGPQFRFVYDSFAQATEVDRFSQFWREFNANLQVLLIQDPYLVGFVVSYPEALDSAINPLGDPAIYSTIKTDVASRSRTWTPGTPLLNIPVAPFVISTNNQLPTDQNNGWNGFDLDPTTFLARPDIQPLPIPVQTAMLRTNLSFAAISKFGQDMQNELDSQIAMATAALAQTNVGFQVETNADQTVAAGGNTTLAFAQTDFDMTGNVTNSTTFTLQAAGTYAVAGDIEWGGTDVAMRTVTVTLTRQTTGGFGAQFGVDFGAGGLQQTVLFTAQDDSEAGPVPQKFSTWAQIEAGDVIQVLASHNSVNPQTVLSGSKFYMIQANSDANAGGFSGDNDNASTKTFTAATNFPAGTVVGINTAGEAAPIDPTTVQQDANGNTIYPFADGIATAAGVAGQPVAVATSYGGIFTPNQPTAFTPGSLIYVGPNGMVTQNYATLITEVQWIICVGKALTAATMLWEPHVPTRFNMAF